MTSRTYILGALLLAIVAVGGWQGWRWYTTPVPPIIPLEGVETASAEAITAAREEVLRDPRSGPAWGKFGLRLAGNGFETPAATCYQHAAKFEPTNPRWLYLHGMLVLKINPREGIALLRAALAAANRTEDRATILFRLSLVLIENGQLDEAEPQIVALAKIEGDGPRVQFAAGLLAIGRGDTHASQVHLKSLIDFPYARKRSCMLLAGLSAEPQQARDYRERAARLPDDEPWPDPFVEDQAGHKIDRMARIEEYWKLKKQGRSAEAIDFLKQFVAESPDEAVCNILGFALFEAQEFEEAIQQLRAAIRLNERSAKSHFILGAAIYSFAEIRSRDPLSQKEAVDLFRQSLQESDRAIELQGNSGFAHLYRGRALQRLGRIDEAIRAYREAALVQPESAEIHLVLGETLAEAKQEQEGLKHIEDAVRLSQPDDPRARTALEKWQKKIKTP